MKYIYASLILIFTMMEMSHEVRVQLPMPVLEYAPPVWDSFPGYIQHYLNQYKKSVYSDEKTLSAQDFGAIDDAIKQATIKMSNNAFQFVPAKGAAINFNNNKWPQWWTPDQMRQRQQQPVAPGPQPHPQAQPNRPVPQVPQSPPQHGQQLAPDQRGHQPQPPAQAPQVESEGTDYGSQNQAVDYNTIDEEQRNEQDDTAGAMEDAVMDNLEQKNGEALELEKQGYDPDLVQQVEEIEYGDGGEPQKPGQKPGLGHRMFSSMPTMIAALGLLVI